MFQVIQDFPGGKEKRHCFAQPTPRIDRSGVRRYLQTVTVLHVVLHEAKIIVHTNVILMKRRKQRIAINLKTAIRCIIQVRDQVWAQQQLFISQNARVLECLMIC